jgi:hypothetical protein
MVHVHAEGDLRVATPNCDPKKANSPIIIWRASIETGRPFTKSINDVKTNFPKRSETNPL